MIILNIYQPAINSNYVNNFTKLLNLFLKKWRSFYWIS